MDKEGETTYRFTDLKIRRQAKVHLYLKHHMSDMHLLGTLLHELGHCFVDTYENDGHTDEWLLTTNYFMHVMGHFIQTIPVLHSARHNLCAVAQIIVNILSSHLLCYKERERERKRERIKQYMNLHALMLLLLFQIG